MQNSTHTAQSVQTASRKLVLMLFDGYLRFTTAAKNAFNEEDLTKKNEGINNNLIRAQNIVTELQSSLICQYQAHPLCLYDYVLLQQANLQKKSETIDEADKVITELRAWAEILLNPLKEVLRLRTVSLVPYPFKLIFSYERRYRWFFGILETLENLLHAETQAIAAHELDTIDAIMLQKDESLRNLLSAKDRLGQDPRNNQPK